MKEDKHNAFEFVYLNQMKVFDWIFYFVSEWGIIFELNLYKTCGTDYHGQKGLNDFIVNKNVDCTRILRKISGDKNEWNIGANYKKIWYCRKFC